MLQEKRINDYRNVDGDRTLSDSWTGDSRSSRCNLLLDVCGPGAPVQDLELFVTVRILEDTLAVLLLGKLCEEHGLSYEWASGQNHSRPKMAENVNATRKTTY